MNILIPVETFLSLAASPLTMAQQCEIQDMLELFVIFESLYFSGISPTEHELLNLLADISNLWYEIGLSLKVPHNILNCLKRSQESDAIKLSEVIHSWLTTTESHLVTWETVIDAIKSPVVNNIKKATEIHEHLTRGK